jgi:hypothetical protein
MKIIKLRDMIVIVCLLAVSALFYFYMTDGNGSIAEIEADGSRVAEVDFSALGENEVKTFEINGVTVKVDREGAYFEKSECTGQVCVKSGKINKAGQTAVCLPQRVSIQISGNNVQYDGVTG